MPCLVVGSDADYRWIDHILSTMVSACGRCTRRPTRHIDGAHKLPPKVVRDKVGGAQGGPPDTLMAPTNCLPKSAATKLAVHRRPTRHIDVAHKLPPKVVRDKDGGAQGGPPDTLMAPTNCLPKSSAKKLAVHRAAHQTH